MRGPVLSRCFVSHVASFKAHFSKFEHASQSLELDVAFADAMALFRAKIPKDEWESGWALTHANEVLITCQALKGLNAACGAVVKRNMTSGAFTTTHEKIAWQTVGALDAVEAGRVLSRHGFRLSEHETLKVAIQCAAPNLLSELSTSAWEGWSWPQWEEAGNGMVVAESERHKRWMKALWPHVAVALLGGSAETDDIVPSIKSKEWLTRTLVGAAGFLGVLEMVSVDSAEQPRLIQQWASNWNDWSKKLAESPHQEDVWKNASATLPDMSETLTKMRRASERELLRRNLSSELKATLLVGVAL